VEKNEPTSHALLPTHRLTKDSIRAEKIDNPRDPRYITPDLHNTTDAGNAGISSHPAHREIGR